MIKYAPNQQVYFNELFSSKESTFLRKNYELDYWGASYLTALEYILDNDQTDEIKIAVENFPGALNITFLKPSYQARVKLVDLDSANYFITNYRWKPKGYTNFEGETYHTITVQGNEITTIFKLK